MSNPLEELKAEEHLTTNLLLNRLELMLPDKDYKDCCDYLSTLKLLNIEIGKEKQNIELMTTNHYN